MTTWLVSFSRVLFSCQFLNLHIAPTSILIGSFELSTKYQPINARYFSITWTEAWQSGECKQTFLASSVWAVGGSTLSKCTASGLFSLLCNIYGTFVKCLVNIDYSMGFFFCEYTRETKHNKSLFWKMHGGRLSVVCSSCWRYLSVSTHPLSLSSW